jgi:hypothetical protein
MSSITGSPNRETPSPLTRRPPLRQPWPPGLYAIITYPVHLSGGTGKVAHVTGDFNSIGEVDLNSGQIVLRYSGQLCSPNRD